MEPIGKLSAIRESLKVFGESVQVGPFRFFENSCAVARKPTMDEWREAGIFVQNTNASQMYWLGDWVLKGEAIFGEEAAQYVDSQHFAETTLKKARWVCEAVPEERRVKELSFEHHAAVSRVKDPREQERWLKKAVAKKWTPTDLRRAMRKQEHEKRYVEEDMPGGKYRVILADPPWHYNDNGVITDNDAYGRAERHYPTMELEKIKALPVQDLAARNCALFLWVPAPLLNDAFEVISAWGFTYKENIVWDKVGHNFGHYISVRHEHLLLATRGSMVPDAEVANTIDSVQSIERSNLHSEKPNEFREIINTLYPPVRKGDRIELFARADVDGWKRWGNETPINADVIPNEPLAEPTNDDVVTDADAEQRARKAKPTGRIVKDPKKERPAAQPIPESTSAEIH
jgi:N6-adenosine-specific RNA methylase IME4